MRSSEHYMSCEDARSIDLVNYLAQLGFQPKSIKGNSYWYCSPLRAEHTPSFKVNRNINRWYDFGMGKGGNLIDFGVLYFNCSLRILLQSLNHSGILSAAPVELKKVAESKILIGQVGYLKSPVLLSYLLRRKIPPRIAKMYCLQVDYQLNQKSFYGIGFRNNSGGYEIRNKYFKGSSSPKDFTLIKNGSLTVSVFEGFIDFLSFLVLRPQPDVHSTDYLILNSLSFFEKARHVMESYQRINLYLDNNPSGQHYSRNAVSQNQSYEDCSSLYENYEDLNDFLTGNPLPPASEIQEPP